MTHRTQRGNLLIADPDLIDPNFFHAVVLILEHDEEGALGLVLNRPTCVSAAQMVPEWKSRVSNPMNIFQGGPIPSKMLIGLADVTNNTEIDTWKPILDSAGIMSVEEKPPISDPGISALRLYSGYSGWTAGQLDSEINTGSWFTVPAGPADLFESNPADLWFRLLHTYHGKWPWHARASIAPSRN